MNPDLQKIRALQSSGRKIVFTNGCFDLLHVGHLHVLSNAKALGDVLVVGLNSDNSIKRLKGSKRPIIPESERKALLLGLKVVDFVIVFTEDTPLSLIKDIKPDVLAKGGDWKIGQIVGGKEVMSWGGKVLSLPFIKEKSTTNIIKKIKEE